MSDDPQPPAVVQQLIATGAKLGRTLVYEGVVVDGRAVPLRDHLLGELTTLVVDMSDDLTAAAKYGSLPYTGEQLRAHYRELLRSSGVEVVLGDAIIRYEAQVECRLLPLLPLAREGNVA